MKLVFYTVLLIYTVFSLRWQRIAPTPPVERPEGQPKGIINSLKNKIFFTGG
jgi:hypothetical protein